MAPTLPPDGRRVWVGGVPLQVTSDDMYDEFEHFGEIESVDVGFDTKISFLLFASKEGALKATERDYMQFKSQRVKVMLANERGRDDAFRKMSKNQASRNNTRIVRRLDGREGRNDLPDRREASQEEQSEARRRSGSERSGSVAQRKPLPRRQMGQRANPKSRPPLRNPRPQQRHPETPRGRNRSRTRSPRPRPRTRSRSNFARRDTGCRGASRGEGSRDRSRGGSRNNRSRSGRSRRSRSSSSPSRRSSSVSSRELVGGGRSKSTTKRKPTSPPRQQCDLSEEENVEPPPSVDQGQVGKDHGANDVEQVEKSLLAGASINGGIAVPMVSRTDGAIVATDDKGAAKARHGSVRSASSARSARSAGSAPTRRSVASAQSGARSRSAPSRSPRSHSARSRSERSASPSPAPVPPTVSTKVPFQAPAQAPAPTAKLPVKRDSKAGSRNRADGTVVAATADRPLLATSTPTATAAVVAASAQQQITPLPDATMPVHLSVLEGDLIGIGLTFRGRRKMVRHHRNTRIGDLVGLHPNIPQVKGKPLIVKDKAGFEVGRELTLEILLREQAAGADYGRPLDLFLSYDEWEN